MPGIPVRNRLQHSEMLRQKLEAAWETSEACAKERTAVALPSKEGMYLEFRGQAGFDLVTRSLEDRRAGICLLNVKTSGEEGSRITSATVYVPGGKESLFLRKIRQYAEEHTREGKPKNAALMRSIEDVRLAVVESFWQDPIQMLPCESAKWCEIWLRTNDNKKIEERLRELCKSLNIKCREGSLSFPERLVLVVKANDKNLAELAERSPRIAEFRLAKETIRFWVQMENKDQSEWVKDLLGRLSVQEGSSVAVCVLDTGANNGHDLLSPILSDADCHSVNPEWGTSDHDGHGTLMCGVVGYGDLQYALENHGQIEISHKLESVKMVPPRGQNRAALYGYITKQALSRAEISAPERVHIACMTVTTEDGLDRGRPSSWSAAVDQLTSGYQENHKRLFVVSAGNVRDPEDWQRYPESNQSKSVEDPAQSWNALTVGAVTEKTIINDPAYAGHEALAPAHGLSPFSTTSLVWETSKWPAKPDIVLEGGNVGISPEGFLSECDELSILSTSHEPTARQFSVINATSAAAGQAAWMAAQVQAAYPNAWPETVRGLMVHSAEWTQQLRKQFLRGETKTDYARLLRICGYGVPNLERALTCARNSLTLIAQDTLQPYDKGAHGSTYYCTRDMHIHELPWPKDILVSLPHNTRVTLRITLSYFIEPSPGAVGWKDRYRYASHALRFDLNSRGESKRDFLLRLNAAARKDEDMLGSDSGSDRWVIGANGRQRGSIHSDIWKGFASEVANCNIVGVYPVVGWWRERGYLGRWNSRARYSLIVSLHTPEETVDIYTPVATLLRIPITI